eukprot:sb/3472320/
MVGRSAPSPAARVALRAIQRSAPDSIFTEFGSVTDVTFMENVFQSYNIVGVVHMAGSLHDGLFSSTTQESWQTVVDAKARGATLLDKLCRKHRDTVQLFICFSSIVSACGNAGQASYGYANSVLDALCRQRVRDGLHGLSIQWGLIGVGMGSTVEQYNILDPLPPEHP